MIVHVIELIDDAVKFFFIYLDNVLNFRNLVTTNVTVLEITDKVSNYLNLGALRNQISDYEESLKQYNRLSMIIVLVLYLYIIRFICNLICKSWDKISNIISLM